MVAYRFEDTEWDKKPNHTQHIGDLRFRQLFTDTDWRELPLPVRDRFGRRVGAVSYTHLTLPTKA